MKNLIIKNRLLKKQPIPKDKIPVVILCGGKGTRLMEETQVIPKPLVRIGEKPILWHIMKIYSTYGFSNFILPVGYKGELIKEYFYQHQILQRDFTIKLNDIKDNIEYHNQQKENWKVTIVDTGLETLTGSRLKKLEQFIDNDIFMFTYGDGLADVNLDKLLLHHSKCNKIATVTAVRPPARFGELILEGKTAKFVEKPQTHSGYINGGFMVFNKKIFQFIGKRDDISLEYNTLETISLKNQLTAYCHNGFWQCMDTLRDLELLKELWESGNPFWKIWK